MPMSGEKASHIILVHEYLFNMMEHEVFNVFMKTASPYCQKISRNNARNDCNSTFELEKKKLKTMLGSLEIAKRIINFCDVPPPHFGVVISDAIFKSLLDWGLKNKVCTIILDNTNNNDAAVRILKDVIQWKLMLGGKIFHVRCCAHIINLLVQDGLSEIETVIENVRESVKYLIASKARLIKFSEIAKQLQLPSKKLIVDCPTCWNATYAMLVATLEFREVFPRYKDRDAGSESPTANIFLPEVWKIKEVLNEKSLDENDYISAMACKMKLKFDKCWGECNFVMAIAAVSDSQFKMTLINFFFPKIYQGFEVARNIDRFVRNADNIQLAKLDLDVYLEEGVFLCSDDSDLDFDALEWWKANNLKFRILSKMAFDILSIPITIVASESAFFTGGRVIDVHQASLSTKTVQALLLWW
ncbi:zinc finger BED domain-containing protein RICESLEEPER 2-like [Castanea sativa]|uniref:zinc finger BED domain-containing protein RICESLEEPER 2-like n=1 Tax=Castanea sativa TaxID=21020 RepID=UPI003F64A8AD